MFWKRFYDLCLKNKTSPNTVCRQLGLSNATATHWKNGVSPKVDIVIKLSEYFDVSTDYLLGTTSVPGKSSNLRFGKSAIKDATLKFENLSESQRAMLKYRIHQLMVNKYRKEDFFAELDKDLGTDNSFKWFRCLNDFSLDEKIPQMLVGTNVDESSIFDTMSIAIKSKSTAQALSMEYAKDAAFPIIVSGNEFFSALSTLSLASLSILENDLPSQISIKQINSADVETDLSNELTASYRTNSSREIAAFGGKATKGTPPKRKPEIT